MEKKNNMENSENFQYTYSAKEQEEIRNIRKKYASTIEEEDKMTQLRKLDASVYSKANTASLVVGILGALLLGTGMSLIMTDLGKFLGSFWALLIGIGVGVIGIVLIAMAYPIYNYTLEREREKIAPDILRLTDELMK